MSDPPKQPSKVWKRPAVGTHHDPSPQPPIRRTNASPQAPQPPQRFQSVSPSHQSSASPVFNLRHHTPSPAGYHSVYESQRFSPSRPQLSHPQQQPSQNQTNPYSLSPLTISDVSYPRPYRNQFSPVPVVSTPVSIPTFSPAPSQSPYMMDQAQYVQHGQQPGRSNDFYVVPLEPTNLPKNVYMYEQDESRPSTADIIAQQSQDYVDEKLAEYQATIMYLQGMLKI